MPSPERGPGGPPPEQPPSREQEPLPYYRAARFAGERPALRAYTRLQDFILRENADLSCFRFQWHQASHVAALGPQPPEDLDRRIARILAAGLATTLPDDVLRPLAQRRAEASKLGPWVERHMRPGGPL